eukprot:3516400-Amphidinium_carterae.1
MSNVKSRGALLACHAATTSCTEGCCLCKIANLLNKVEWLCAKTLFPQPFPENSVIRPQFSSCRDLHCRCIELLELHIVVNGSLGIRRIGWMIVVAGLKAALAIGPSALASHRSTAEVAALRKKYLVAIAVLAFAQSFGGDAVLLVF